MPSDISSAAEGSVQPMTFLLTSSVATGHLLRVLDLASQLSAHGHRVLVHAKANVAAEVKAASAEHIPYERHVDFGDRALLMQMSAPPSWMPTFPYRVAQVRGMMNVSGLVLAQEIEPILRRERVDCLVYDFFEFGAAWAAERVGIPYASAGNLGTTITRDGLPLMVQKLPVLQNLAKVPRLLHGIARTLLPFGAMREKLGLPRYEGHAADMARAMAAPDLHIIMAPPSLVKGLPLRDNQLFVGPTAFNVSKKKDAEALEFDPGTVIVSTTTTGKDDGLFRRVLEAVAPLNVPILGTAASADDIPTGLGPHIRIEQYVPHDAVFPKARALITHGGWGTVGRALTHGLPMLVIPIFGDQFLNGAMVERAGLGRLLPRDKATPEAIQAELRALLADDALRARAQRSAAEVRQL
jgi:MGT family glycosyltransferase